MTQAYPLHWPEGFPRTKTRMASRLRATLPGAVKNVTEELRRFGNDTGLKVSDVVVSADATLMDPRPDDPGVACYFVWDKVQACIAVDRYNKIEENLQAIARIIEAGRTKMRHGGLNIVRAAFRGYASLPPPDQASAALNAPWQQVLGVPHHANLDAAMQAIFAAINITGIVRWKN